MKRNLAVFWGMIAFACLCTGCATNRNLFYAAAKGDLAKVQRLVEKGADINYQHSSLFGRASPLFAASSKGQLGVVKYLVENGADINAKTRDGSVPLHNAAYLGHFAVVQYLVENGADINVRNNAGDSALSYAYNTGHIQIYDYLKEHGGVETASSGSSSSGSSSGSLGSTQKSYMLMVTYQFLGGIAPVPAYDLVYVEANSASEAKMLAEREWRSKNTGNLTKFVSVTVTASD
jgi:ankyrin repeat protein